MIGVVVVLLVAYSGLLLYYSHAWRKLTSRPAAVTPGVTVLIPARNEAVHLPALLHDLSHQSYPGHVDIIVLDDHSTDNTSALAVAQGVKVIRLADHPAPVHVAFKKHALTLGVRAATSPWVVAVDADSRLGPDWLTTLMRQVADEVHLIAGPVVMEPGRGLLCAFQQWDMLGMQLFTGGGVASGHPMLVNGANLAFTCEAFDQVDGFAGTTDKASGDDIFLLHKIKAHFGTTAIRYAAEKEAIVTTRPVPTWHALWHQRIRWASKTTRMTDGPTFLLMGTAFLFHLAALTAVVWGFVEWHAWIGFGIAIVGKYVVERWSLSPIISRWQLAMPWYWLPVSQLIYLPYVVLVGFLGNFISYRWKGRKVQ